MKKNKLKTVAIISVIIFILFLTIFNISSKLVQNGIIDAITLSMPLQGVLSFLGFFPIMLASYAFGKYLHTQNKHRAGTSFVFVGVALFIYGLIQMILGLLGFYG